MGKRYLPRRCALGQKITSGLFIRQVSNEEHSKNHLIMIISLFRIIHTKKIAVLKKWKIKTSRYTLAITAIKNSASTYLYNFLFAYLRKIHICFIHLLSKSQITHALAFRAILAFSQGNARTRIYKSPTSQIRRCFFVLFKHKKAPPLWKGFCLFTL